MSMIGLTLLLPLLLIESDFSLTFGGLPLSGLALWGIYSAMRRTTLANDKRNVSRARVTAIPLRERVGTEDQPILPAG
jgi:hypothetical protein